MARVLIVDDEKSIRTTLAEFIREEGHEVFTAADATQALGLLVEKEPAVVVTDIILPRMTGIALLKSVNEIAPDTQVLMITGEPTAETAAEAVRLGAFDYLSKPIARTDFKSSVTSALRVTELALERRRLEEENQRYQEHLEEEVVRKTGALRDSEEKYRAVVENASESVFVAQNGVLPFVNPSTVELCGRTLKELRTTPFIEYVHPDDRPVFAALQRRVLVEDRSASRCQFRLIRPDGSIRWLELQAVPISWDDESATLNFANDITERKRAESKERARQERIQKRDRTLVQLAMSSMLYQGSLDEALRAITEAAALSLQVGGVSVWQFDANDEAIELFQLRRAMDTPPDGGQRLKRKELPEFFRALAEERVIVADDARTDARTTELAASYLSPLGITALLGAPVRLEGKLVGVVTFEQIGDPRQWEQDDIEFACAIADLVSLTLEAVNKRRAEDERARSEARYKTLFESSPISLWQEDLSATKTFTLELASTGVPDLRTHFLQHPEDLAEAVRKTRIEDINEATLRLHHAHSKQELLQGLDNVFTDASAPCFIDQLVAISEGKCSYEGTSTERTLDGQDIQIAIRWIAAPGYEDSLKRVLVSKVDITTTVEVEKSLQEALDGTIGAISMATETRDPYTAGHQRRVTELAVAIAARMKLDTTTIEGTRVAGLMHDIGKLAIPAEILSKPSLLSDMERSLIESHPRAAYDILQTVSFPWPIAQIVLQHHERIDGSGYPQALRGDDILIEARILAVADTVEAMASHRPYRPALGIDVALEEIERGRGVLFDADVVDACVSLFRDGDFAFRNHVS